VTVAVSVTVSVSVSDPVWGPESGVRGPGSGVRLLQRDQVNPVMVSDSVTVSGSVSVTGSDAPHARPAHFHGSTGGRAGHAVIPRRVPAIYYAACGRTRRPAPWRLEVPK